MVGSWIASSWNDGYSHNRSVNIVKEICNSEESFSNIISIERNKEQYVDYKAYERLWVVILVRESDLDNWVSTIFIGHDLILNMQNVERERFVSANG